MKKYIFAALLCCMMAAPTSARAERIGVLDMIEMLIKKARNDYNQRQEFFQVCVSIINVHTDFEDFNDPDLLGDRLRRKMVRGNYTLDEAVEIIYRWWMDYDCYDILVEWCEIEDFFDIMPDKYTRKYDW